MSENKLVKVVSMNCPICGLNHEVELRKRNTWISIKGEDIIYEEQYFYCSNAREDENEFVTGAMSNDNLLKARDAYREKVGLLTSEEIISIRKSYGLSQKDLAIILDIEEEDISRYETKAIQDKSLDMKLRYIIYDTSQV